MDKRLEKYCALAVRSGVNVQKGQTLLLNAPVDLAPMVRLVAEEAYRAGAGNVVVMWNDEKLARTRYLNSQLSVFERFEPWEKLRYEEMSKENAALLSLISGDPEANKGIDPAKLMAYARARSAALEPFQKRLLTGEILWSIFSAPSKAWAEKVFPGAKDAEDRLWEAIYAACRIDEESDPVENWQRHSAGLERRAKILNDYDFKALIYQNELGTELEIGLTKGHIWAGGGDVSKDGIRFLPNIPTEEIFTAPHCGEAEGVVYGTKPLVYQGNLIEDFAIWFEGGRVKKVEAKANKALLESLISSFPNADRLGEAALVPYDSPISRSGVLFYNTLFDENASCHLALGSAYASGVKGAEGLSDEELQARGINQSQTHNDFMIGSKDLSITGVRKDGSKIAVFEGGNFVF
ncbi:MAG: aminopeptidase [Christensenellaceae bacterium]|nr:aminopeptidase [Christensenellaceae bacterium]